MDTFIHTFMYVHNCSTCMECSVLIHVHVAELLTMAYEGRIWQRMYSSHLVKGVQCLPGKE